ncbi:MAG TPA: DUF2142 domain-containing protein [Acidimicrobiales bacterium]|nr:DUF2142 domain-containing protein [Acidimicrobiales bacterium]
MVGGRSARGWRPSPFLVLFVLFLVTTTASAAWHPLYSAPDEPTHVIRAAAVARGQLRYARTTPAPGLPSSVVRVPRVFADSIYTPQCYIFQAGLPANCAALPSGTDDVRGFTYVGRYPPLYYLAVGLPSLLWRSNRAVYAMRFLSGAICALFLAKAMAIAFGLRRPLLLVGVAVATTPMVLYLASVVNPSGPEIAAAICLWTAVIAVGLTRDVSRRGPLPWAVLSAVVVASARPSGQLWIAGVAAVAFVTGVLSPVRPLLRSRSVKLGLAAVGVSVLLTVAWTVWVGGIGATGLPLVSARPAWLLSLGMTGQRLQQLVAYYGWLDTPVPTSVYGVWAVAVSAAVVAGVLTARSRRYAAGILLLVAGVILVSVPFEVLEAHRIGLFWQGRYTLPLAAGVPIVALARVPADRLRAVRRSWARLAAALVLVTAHLVAMNYGIRRFAVGTTGPRLFFSRPAWSPPLPHWVLATAYAVGLAGIGACVARGRASSLDVGDQQVAADVQRSLTRVRS